MEWKTVLPNAVGGLIIGLFALWGIHLTNVEHKRRDRKRQLKLLLGVIHAVQAELKEIYGVLDRRDVKELWRKVKNKEKKFFSATYPVPLDYLIIYRSNANYIGQIENPDLRDKIVTSYMELQSLMERYRTNNLLLRRYHDAKDNGETDLSCNLSLQLENITGTLQQEYDRFKSSADNLFKEIKKELSKLEKELSKLEEELSKLSYGNPAQTISILRSSSPTKL